MIHRIHPAELQLNKANASDTEAAFLDLNLSIHNDTVSTKIYYNGMILILILLIFLSLVAMSFARASSHVNDFNNRNKFLTVKLLKQGYRYHKLRKTFSKFYRRHFELIEKYHVSLKNVCNTYSNPEFYGDLVYKFNWKSKLL